MKRIVLLSLFSLFIITSSAFSENAQAATTLGLSSGTSIAPMLKKIMPAVVNIAAQGEIVLSTVTDKKSDKGGENNGGDDKSTSPLPYGSVKEFASLGSGVVFDAAKGY